MRSACAWAPALGVRNLFPTGEETERAAKERERLAKEAAIAARDAALERVLALEAQLRSLRPGRRRAPKNE